MSPLRNPAILLLAAWMYTFAPAAAQDTISVYFPTDVYHLPRAEEKRLDSLRYLEVLNPGRPVRIVGYADYVGASGYNDTLSRRRADRVRTHLLASGYAPGRIELCIGKGAVPRHDRQDMRGYAPDRRVDIVILKSGAGGFGRPRADTIRKQPEPVRSNAMPVRGQDAQPEYPVAEVKKHLEDILEVNINEAVLLSRIFFPPNSHYVTSDSRPELDALVEILRQHPAMKIRIEGHICCVRYYPDAWDEDAGDYRLSLNRALFIRDYLIRKGIRGDRLQFNGYGRSRPVVPEELTEEDGQKNRRVEVRVLSR